MVIRTKKLRSQGLIASLMLAGFVAMVALFLGGASAQGKTPAAQETTAGRGQNTLTVQATNRDFGKTSTRVQSDWYGYIESPAGVPITPRGDPFHFRNTSNITDITRVTITTTIYDGDTGYYDFDRGNLILALDGIKTGIKLNGFYDEYEDTNTISGVPTHARQIKAALKKDGKLSARVVDNTLDDNYVEIPSYYDTTLKIQGKMR